jgi:hypothetical protein
MKFIFDNFRKKPFKIFYNTFVPHKTRKQWDYNYDEIPTQDAVAKFWQTTLDDYEKGKISSYEVIVNRPDLVGKKIIWQYWAQGIENAPDFVKFCFSSVERYKGDYEVIRITDNTLEDYLIFPEFVKQKRLTKVFKPVFFSDLLRVSLIKNYGGVWLDASVVLTDYLPSQFTQQSFFMFSRDSNSKNKEWGLKADKCYFNWDDQFKVRYLSSILFGTPHSKVSQYLQDLLLYFWEKQETIPHYFFYQILINELKQGKWVEFEYPIIDDTFPHLMQFDMNKTFNPVRFDEILKSSSLHKLSYHKQLLENDKNGSPTFYGYLKNQFFK